MSPMRVQLVLSLVLCCGCHGFMAPPPVWARGRSVPRAAARGRFALSAGGRPGGYGRFDNDVVDSSRDQEADGPWKRSRNADVLLPDGVQLPLGIVHFMGGVGVGSFPRNTYGAFLEGLAAQGFLVVATPVPFSEFNHESLACDAARDFRLAYRDVEAFYGAAAVRRVPVLGLGHSLGAKVHALMGCYEDVRGVARRRKANVFVSFNNFPAQESVPLLGELKSLGQGMRDPGALRDGLSGLVDSVAEMPLMGLAAQGLSMAEEWAPKVAMAVGNALSDVPQEFVPSPEATWRLLETSYTTPNNLVLQFRGDSIDQSRRLADTLFMRFGRAGELEYCRLEGTHLTPNTPDLRAGASSSGGRGGEAGPWDRSAQGWADEQRRAVSAEGKRQLDDLVRATVRYLRSQAVWDRGDDAGLSWDSDSA